MPTHSLENASRCDYCGDEPLATVPLNVAAFFVTCRRCGRVGPFGRDEVEARQLWIMRTAVRQTATRSRMEARGSYLNK
jgi:Fe2+ or Zn2+ uptake regulation protein